MHPRDTAGSLRTESPIRSDGPWAEILTIPNQNDWPFLPIVKARVAHDYRLVALSVLLATVAAYAALELAGRLTAARGWPRVLWLAGGSTAMGMGIWAMHYVDMLALSIPMPVFYHLPTVVLSLMAAIAASATALFVVSRI